MKKTSKSAKIVAYKKANPKAKYEEIAKAVGCNRSLIGNVLSKAGLTRKYTKRKPTKGQQILREHIRKEAQRTDAPNVHALNVEIFRLRQQVAGYIAVISYLESKLGIDENGTPV
jgi:hypothetical protein